MATSAHRESPWGSAIPIAALLLTAVIGFATVIITRQTIIHVDASRVEIGRPLANNFPELDRWGRWSQGVTPKNEYVGVQRLVTFRQSFQNAPQVSAAFNVVEVRSFKDIMRQIGHIPDPDEDARLNEIHIVTF